MAENKNENVDSGMNGPAPQVTDVQIATAQMVAQKEIEGAIILAKKFPRDIDAAFQKLMTALRRKSLAEAAAYSFPRGGQNVNGPSVNLARVAAQYYQNIRWGLDILKLTDQVIAIRGWAWDIENNIKVTADDEFKKLIYRKSGGWIVPDERDLRELINRRGAILVRNCLLQVIPRDLIEDAMGVARETIKKDIKDPKGEAKHLIMDFSAFGVTVEMLKGYLGVDEFGVEEIVTMKEMLTSLRDGNSTKSDYFGAKAAASGSDDREPGSGPQPGGNSAVEEIEALESDLIAAKKLTADDIPKWRQTYAGKVKLSEMSETCLKNYTKTLKSKLDSKSGTAPKAEAGDPKSAEGHRKPNMKGAAENRRGF